MPIIVNDKRDPVKFAIGERIRHLQEHDPEELKKMLRTLSPEEAQELQYDDEVMLREKQWIDLGDPDIDLYLMLMGRGAGKSFTIAATIKRAVEKHGVRNLMLIAPTARTLSRSLAPEIISRYEPGHPNTPRLRQGFISWPNGAELIMIPAEAGPDSVRGNNVEVLFLDEAAFYGNNSEIIAQAELTCRIAPAKTIVATTPSATEELIDWVRRAEEGDPTIKLITGSTYENKANLSKKFVNTVLSKYKGTRLEDSEILGILRLENEDALFSMVEIERYEIKDKNYPFPKFVEYSIGVDPALNSKSSQKNVGKKQGRKPDAVGIIVSALGEDGLIYVLENHTKRYGTGAAWNQRVCDLWDYYSERGKTTMTVEINAIGREYLSLGFDQIGRIDVGRQFKPYFSTESKLARMSPYALMHDQGKIRWYNPDARLDPLFKELTTYTGVGASPNALDSLQLSLVNLAPSKKRFTNIQELII